MTTGAQVHQNQRLPRRQLGIVRSEWTKLMSIRSTYWTLAIAAITAISASGVLAVSSRGTGKAPPFDQLATIFVGWLEYPVLAIGIFGVLTFTSEYSSGQIRTTFAAVPKRLSVLVAKLLSVTLLVVALGEIVSFISYFITIGVVTRQRHSLALSQPNVIRGVVAAGLCLAAITAIGLALGAIFRQTASALIALPTILYLPLISLSLPAPWDGRLIKFSFVASAYQLVSLHPHRQLFSYDLSIVIVLLWPGMLLSVAALLIKGRDA